MREHIKKRHPTSQAARSIVLESSVTPVPTPPSTSVSMRTYPPIAPAPAKLAPTTLLLQPPQHQQPMTSLILPNGMIYLMNQTTPTFQQPLLVSMPPQQQLFLANPGLTTFGSQFLTTGGGSPFIFTQSSLPVTSQPTQIFLNTAAASTSALSTQAHMSVTPALPAAPSLSVAPVLSAQPAATAAAAQLPTLDQQISFGDGSFRLESDNRLTFKGHNGETVKLDILERAILEIPNLANEH